MGLFLEKKKFFSSIFCFSPLAEKKNRTKVFSYFIHQQNVKVETSCESKKRFNYPKYSV